MEQLIQYGSPRLYQEIWVEKCPENEEERKRGGARFRQKLRLIDEIAEGVAMGLSCPVPSFAKAAALLGKQAFKGVKDNVQHYRRQRCRGPGSIFSFGVKTGYKLAGQKTINEWVQLEYEVIIKILLKPWE